MNGSILRLPRGPIYEFHALNLKRYVLGFFGDGEGGY